MTYVIRQGIWGRTAHMITRREDIVSPDGEGMGARIHVRCSDTPLYWWDAVSDTTRGADRVCGQCIEARNAEAHRYADMAGAVGRLADDLATATFANGIGGLAGKVTDWHAHHADSLEVLCLRREADNLYAIADDVLAGRL